MNPESDQPLDFATGVQDRLTHYLFRYPAKFHPPVARALIENFSSRGEWILDPFCGSGTVLVEASTIDRNVIGYDLDPVAVFVSTVKSHKFDVQKLKKTADKLTEALLESERPAQEYQKLQWKDINEEEFNAYVGAESSWIPAIPKLPHWFRLYVAIDMSKILGVITRLDCPKTHREFLRLCFCNIIRACSNADPVPVSGLEVTKHMKDKERQGRLINPFAKFRDSLKAALQAVEAFSIARTPNSVALVRQCDATTLTRKLRRPVDCVITSPPYYTAVDYYRRHQLEMYWMGFVKTQEQRKELIPQYIGRRGVSSKHPLLRENPRLGPIGTEWMSKIQKESNDQINTFKHYIIAMDKVFEQIFRVTKRNGKVVIVIGNSKVAGTEMPTADLLKELAEAHFRVVDRSWYHIKDRYMSYSRKNGADIGTEHVLVFQPIH